MPGRIAALRRVSEGMVSSSSFSDLALLAHSWTNAEDILKIAGMLDWTGALFGCFDFGSVKGPVMGLDVVPRASWKLVSLS